MKQIIKNVALLVLVFTVFACSDNENIITNQVTSTQFIDTYAKIASASYEDSYNTAVAMKTKIDAFLAAPSETTLQVAKASWLYARNYYGQTEAFREANGPIDNVDILGNEGQINAWPLDEGYIDYVTAINGSIVQNGLIGDISIELIEADIIARNEGDNIPENVSTGWHAIEFLLWGQDLNYDPVNNTYDNYATAGSRPFTDYTTADFADRRAAYLKIITDLLIKDLKALSDTWAEEGPYRKTFMSLSENVALTNILNGIAFISNGEVALERIDPAIDEGQENEQSCFSDNTNQDMWANVHGINNIIVGEYTRENGNKIIGVSLIELSATINQEVSNNLEAKSKVTLEKLNALLALNKSFDAIIAEETLGSNGPAGQLSSALKEQGIAIAKAATSLGVTITIN